MSDTEIRSLAYLRDLSRLIEDWQEDPACQCCDWAVGEIERLTRERDEAKREFPNEWGVR